MPQPNHTAPDPAAPALRDPGARLALWIAIAAAILFYVVVAFFQNSPQAPSETVAPVGGGPVDMQADLAFRLTIRMGPALDTGSDPARMLAPYARTDREKLYLSVTLAEIKDPADALDRLPDPVLDPTSEEQPEADRAFWRDVDAFERIFVFARDGGTGSPVDAGVIDQSTADGLLQRHGFYAEVALTSTLDPSTPESKSLRSVGAGLIVMALIILTVGVGVIAGFGLFITAIVLLALRRIRPVFEAPAPGGSVFLETFALFVGSFLLLKVVIGALESGLGPTSPVLGYASVVLQWCLLIVPFWPLLRGMPRDRFCRAIGLHRGAGFFREFAVGVLGYLAGIPIFLAAVVLTIILMSIRQAVLGDDATPPSNPMFDILAGASPLMLFLFLTLATVWAPLCEELVFRGALYRHLRGYLPAVIAALLVGVLFAFMHNYGPLLTPPLIALGFNFALLREWRGSLIAPITAHFLHNGVSLGLAILLIKTLME